MVLGTLCVSAKLMLRSVAVTSLPNLVKVRETNENHVIMHMHKNYAKKGFSRCFGN